MQYEKQEKPTPISIINCNNGMYLYASSSALFKEKDIEVGNCVFNSIGNSSCTPIDASYLDSLQVFNNVFSGLTVSGTQNCYGISGSNLNNCSIYNNKITNSATSYRFWGMYVNNGTGIFNIYNNEISNISSSGGDVYGINATSGSACTYNIYNNKQIYSSDIYDVTIGTDGKYNATVGYDICTGLGSCIANNLCKSLS